MHSKNTLVHCAQLMILAKRKGLTFNDMKTRFHGGSSLTLPKHHSVLEQVCKAVEVPLKHMTPGIRCLVPQQPEVQRKALVEKSAEFMKI